MYCKNYEGSGVACREPSLESTRLASHATHPLCCGLKIVANGVLASGDARRPADLPMAGLSLPERDAYVGNSEYRF